jgi:hypothetical protein
MLPTRGSSEGCTVSFGPAGGFTSWIGRDGYRTRARRRRDPGGTGMLRRIPQKGAVSLGDVLKPVANTIPTGNEV